MGNIVDNFLLIIRRDTEILIKQKEVRERKREKNRQKKWKWLTAISVSALPMQIHLNVPFLQNYVEFPSRPIGDTAMRWDNTEK